ncbi:hypothetical protein HCU74_03635 [Spongiibacter sp. KMU-166]|uniref:Outer membrane lipoprotein n=1 Tax=Spongiibacter thalassae TaxID=2721624 RepID=A0ABX1GD41_9GAMM|nr:hypothetical protein [Spongiibacter thalassae]NKI16508.1 hypothetical protein [Spongiibacter thalassae]
MKEVVLLTVAVLMVGCVASPPKLSYDEQVQAKKIEIYRANEVVPSSYTKVGEVEVADCSGQGGGWVRITGDESNAIEGLLFKAFSLEADAVINVSCKSTPYLNNCWVSKHCTGLAVTWDK